MSDTTLDTEVVAIKIDAIVSRVAADFGMTKDEYLEWHLEHQQMQQYEDMKEAPGLVLANGAPQHFPLMNGKEV